MNTFRRNTISILLIRRHGPFKTQIKTVFQSQVLEMILVAKSFSKVRLVKRKIIKRRVSRVRRKIIKRRVSRMKRKIMEKKLKFHIIGVAI